MSSVYNILEERFPELLSKHPGVAFKLRTQCFVELIRARRIDEAYTYARQYLKPYGSNPEYISELSDIFSLIAYEYPETSPESGLLEEQTLRHLIELVNCAVLEDEEIVVGVFDPLEFLCRQLVVICDELNSEKVADSTFSAVRNQVWHTLHDAPETESMDEEGL